MVNHAKPKWMMKMAETDRIKWLSAHSVSVATGVGLLASHGGTYYPSSWNPR
jgi:hypothetical protein